MWSTHVDIYCERTDPGFWAEPVNALTNLAFLVAAAVALVEWRRTAARDWAVLVLIIIVAVIGLGSFAFHTLATRGAALLDVIPIAIFIYSYLLFALRRYFALPWIWTILALAAFALVSFATRRLLPPDFLNGSVTYLPALGALVIIGFLIPDPARRRTVLLAAGVFIVSVFFRSIDQAVCQALLLGTHFLWHLLNGCLLYILLRAAMIVPAQPPDERSVEA